MIFLVETGANVTILKPSVLERIPLPGQPSLDQVKTNMLLRFLGRGRFHVAVGGAEIEHEIWIVEIELDGIPGMDFIRVHNCQLNLGQGRFEFSINGKTIYCQEGGNSPRCARIPVGTRTVIPPKCEALVPAKLIESCGDTSLLVTQGQTARIVIEKQQGIIPKTRIVLV